MSAPQYDGIYFNQSRVAGSVRIMEAGLGWRATQKLSAGSSTKVSEPFLLPATELLGATWSRGAHDYMMQIRTRGGAVVSLDGFEQEQFVALQRSLRTFLDVPLEHREHSLRGWNWGKAEFDRNELVFNVASKPDFEVPYHVIASSNVVGKSEVAVELALPPQSEKTSTGDEVVEMRFFIPSISGDAEGSDEEQDGDQEDVNSAKAFHEQLQDRADIGSAAGSELAQFMQVLFTTPRGRYDIAFFDDSFRLHGKTYDYKVPYASVLRLFVLPRLDELHSVLVLQLDPPLRQGQTRYPFLVMQFSLDETTEVELNIDDDSLQKYSGRLNKTYEGATSEVVSSLFRGLTNRKITVEGSFRSMRNLPAVSCLLKATEAALYPLDKAFLLVTKTPLYVPNTEVSSIKFSRLATGNRSFDLTLNLIGGQGDIQLTGLSRDEQPILEQYFESKNISTKNDAVDARKARIAGVESQMLDELDEESEDEDFDEEPPSESEGSESDGSVDSDVMSDVDDDDDDDDDDDEHLDTGDSKIKVKSERKRARQ